MRTFCTLLLAILLLVSPAVPVFAADKPAAASAKAELIDINAASEAQLKTLPGIGDAYAKKIVAGRPYARKDQLKTKGIIPAATYDKIQDRIVARQP